MNAFKNNNYAFMVMNILPGSYMCLLQYYYQLMYKIRIVDGTLMRTHQALNKRAHTPYLNLKRNSSGSSRGDIPGGAADCAAGERSVQAPSRAAPPPNMWYNLEIDAEWYYDEINDKPPLNVPPRFITLQIRDVNMDSKMAQQLNASPSKRVDSKGACALARKRQVVKSKMRRRRAAPNPRKVLLEHPMWAQFNEPNPVKFKREGRRAVPAPDSWEGDTPIPTLLGKNWKQRAPRTDEKLSHLPKFHLTITIFYSFADVVALLGTRLSTVLVDSLMTGKCIRILNNWAPLPHVIIEHTASGQVIERQLDLRIRDLYSLEYESLQSTAAAYNVPMPNKDLMDGYKDRMNVAYSDPELRPQMIEYALGDLVLADLWDAYLNNYKELCEVSGVEPQLPPPASKGAFVAHLFERALNSTIKLPHDFNTIFDISRPKSAESAGVSLYKDTQSADVCPPSSAPPKSHSIAHLLKNYGCKALAKSDDSLTKQFLAIVHGGRVNNENPLIVRRSGVIMSMDIVSCYGQALQYLHVPIGHPALFYYPHHHPHEWPTLHEFLKRYRSELVEGCWYMVVDTCGDNLTTPQNLLYSKYFKHDVPEILEQAKEYAHWSEDLAHVKGDFMLLENEVRNGILTHYSLSVIEHCASNQEIGELFTKLRVKAAMIYPKSLCIEYTGPESVEKWIDMARNSKGKLNTWGDMKSHGVSDNRIGPWLKYPLGTFITPLLERRRSLKAKMKQHSKDTAEWRRFNAAQLSVKKVVNTLYGTLASIYFPISSPCVANNVTDRARTACWLMSVAGAGLTSITDGCESMLNEVRWNKDKAPSLATAAHLHMPHLLNERTRLRHWTAPLGSEGDQNLRWDVDGTGKITGPGLDQPVDAATAIKLIESKYDAHLREYFTFSGKPLPAWCDTLKFECKLLGRDIALHGSANYAINTLPGDTNPPLIKARGHRLNANHYHPENGAPMESPMRTMMLCRLRGDTMLTRQSAICYKPASVSEYRKRGDFREQGGLPGYSIAKHANVRLITCTEFNYPTMNSRITWMNYYSYLNRRYGLGLEAVYIQDAAQLTITVEQLEAAKADIQHRIYTGDSPSSRRVPRYIRPLNEREEAGEPYDVDDDSEILIDD